MTRDEFVQEYGETLDRALRLSGIARRQGFLALDDEVDQAKANGKDVFEYGIRLLVDAYDRAVVEKVLSNIAAQEPDEYTRLLKTIQKEAVLMIQDGLNPRLLSAVMNSYTDLPVGA